ncbi:MAG: squalene synthase HpnC [Rhodospirillaceae bacterium TMED8]|nr:squalene synthase HpnC [Magnetovibrio sp.]OUT50251.1 MAG: squalene synthase HpnC [Rhodospirillaceae bacterium TMED8]
MEQYDLRVNLLDIDESIETPSGKNTGYENFPVGSFLLPVKLRPHISTFYRFARTVDDIADSSTLPPTEKITRLEGFENALLGINYSDPKYNTGHKMRISLAETKTTSRHCLDLIEAFKQDVTQNRYQDWDDLMYYCERSAAPVGRYLVDIHDGGKEAYEFSDALCKALQVINHIQDCQEDFRMMDRVYLPCNWFREKGISNLSLNKDKTSPPLRYVFDRCLDATEDLMTEACQLPVKLKNRRLAMESAIIIKIANTLIQRLRKQDPLVSRVTLGKSTYLWACLRGFGELAFGNRT